MGDAMKVWKSAQKALREANWPAEIGPAAALEMMDRAAASVIQTALDEARADERRAIVAKLIAIYDDGGSVDGLIWRDGLMEELEQGPEDDGRLKAQEKQG